MGQAFHRISARKIRVLKLTNEFWNLLGFDFSFALPGKVSPMQSNHINSWIRKFDPAGVSGSSKGPSERRPRILPSGAEESPTTRFIIQGCTPRHTASPTDSPCLHNRRVKRSACS